MTSLSVVIVTAAQEATNLARCLSSLSTQSISDFEIIVVCSGVNAPKRPDRLTGEGLASRTKFITIPNRGYGAACNEGVRISGAASLIFLNDDTSLHADFIKTLHEALSKDENCIFQSLISHEYAQKVMRGNPCDVYGAAGLGFYGNCGTGEFYASGASFAISKKAFDRLGGFDEKLFLYYEDVDLCWRARLAGLRISAAESAICDHTGGASSGTMPHADKFYFTQRNRIRVMIKNYSARKILTRLPTTCSLIIMGGLFLGIEARRVQYFVSIVKAFAWNLFALQSTLIERYRTQGNRVQGEAEIETAMSTYSMDVCVLKRHVTGA